MSLVASRRIDLVRRRAIAELGNRFCERRQKCRSPEGTDGPTPLKPGFNFDRYDRELRRPFPSAPQFAPDSKIWQREHALADDVKSATPGRDSVAFTSYSQRLEYQ